MYMRNQEFRESWNQSAHLWNYLFFAAVITGLCAGLIGVIFPRSIFYETAGYYSESGWQSVSDRQDSIEVFAYFISIRVLFPLVIVFTAILWKNIRLLMFCVWAELTSISFQTVLLFGIGGMDAVFRNLMYCLLPDSCYVLSLILVFCEKKSAPESTKQYIFTIIRSTFLLFCGAVVEIYLFSYFQH